VGTPILASLSALILLGCAGAATPAPPPAEDDPAIAAAIDSLLETAMAGSAAADADRVLAFAADAPRLTFLTGDVLVSGLDSVRTAFAKTYSSIRSQHQTVLSKRVRVLGPDLALLLVTGEGAYMDTNGVVSEPVGLGFTIVFVRRGGKWIVEHAHQSIAP